MLKSSKTPNFLFLNNLYIAQFIAVEKRGLYFACIPCMILVACMQTKFILNVCTVEGSPLQYLVVSPPLPNFHPSSFGVIPKNGQCKG